LSDPARFVDLHVHTTASDGALSPREVVARALEAGLAAIAVTDPDEVAGVAPALAAAGELAPGGRAGGPGVELTAYVRPQVELHILGYFVEVRHGPLLERLERFRRVRRERAERFVANLRSLGLDVDFKDVLTETGGEAIGRPHIAAALLARGLVASIDEAFRRHLSEKSPAYVPKEQISPEEAIGIIHAAGGLAVLAHPGVGKRGPWVGRLAEMGLDGVEAYHPYHSPSGAGRLERLAEKHGLLVTGGSDFHGGPGAAKAGKGAAPTGKGAAKAEKGGAKAGGGPHFPRSKLGRPGVPCARLEAMRRRLEGRKA